MRRIRALAGSLALVTLVSSCASQAKAVRPAAGAGVRAPSAESLSLEVDGLARSYLLYRPPNLRAGAPLVFVIHGFTDSARNMMYSSRMNALADTKGFAVCYPQGLKDGQGRTYWEVGYSFTASIPRDDVTFLTTLARHLQDSYGLSRENTFATGMSNGAEMCVMLGLFAPDTFKAIAPIAGCVMEKTYQSVMAVPPIPAFLVNGDADGTTNWNGDMEDREGWGAYRPVDDLVALFTRDDPGLVKTTRNLPDKDPKDGSHIVADTYINNGTGRQVWFYRVVGGGHDWPGKSGNKDIDVSEEIWRFFSMWVS